MIIRTFVTLSLLSWTNLPCLKSKRFDCVLTIFVFVETTNFTFYLRMKSIKNLFRCMTVLKLISSSNLRAKYILFWTFLQGVIQQLCTCTKFYPIFTPSPLNKVDNCGHFMQYLPFVTISKWGLSTDPLPPSSCLRSY